MNETVPKTENKRRRRLILGGLILLGAVFYVTLMCLCVSGSEDVFSRYAPMAQAFATGRFAEAFHPRFGVGFQVVSGCVVWMTGGLLDGWQACRFVSFLALYLSFFPLFNLLKRVFDRTAAWFGVLLLACSPQVLLWVTEGMRESFRMLGILLLADAIFACRDGARRYGLVMAALGAVVLCSIRVDSIVAAFFLVFVFCCIDRFTRRSWILCGVTFLALQPTSFLVWKWTGWWLPAIQYVNLLKKVMG